MKIIRKQFFPWGDYDSFPVSSKLESSRLYRGMEAWGWPVEGNHFSKYHLNSYPFLPLHHMIEQGSHIIIYDPSLPNDFKIGYAGTDDQHNALLITPENHNLDCFVIPFFLIMPRYAISSYIALFDEVLSKTGIAIPKAEDIFSKDNIRNYMDPDLWHTFICDRGKRKRSAEREFFIEYNRNHFPYYFN